jgi:uncharacterized integral membrane protein
VGARTGKQIIVYKPHRNVQTISNTSHIQGGYSMGIIIIPAIIVILIAVFSVQNASPVAISFLFWKADVSLALAILVSALAGIIVGAVIISVVIRKMSRNSRGPEGKSPRN